MNKFFQSETEDGTVIHRKDSETIGIKINPDGLVYLGGLPDDTQEGFGVIFGGGDFFASYFKLGVPEGESLMLRKNQVTRIVFRDGIIEGTEKLDHEKGWSFLGSFLCHGVIQDSLRISDLCSEDPPIEWTDVIDQTSFLPGVNKAHILNSRGDLLGYLGSEQVLLTKLSPHPPSGFFEIAGGIRIKELDIWKRKLDKLTCPAIARQNFTTIKGFCKCDGNMYVVSSFPPNVEEIRLSTPSTSHDFLVDVISQVLVIVQELTRLGVTWGGLVTRDSFITTTDGELHLNTGYLLSRFTEEKALFGGHTIEELRFMSPNQIVRVSTQTKLILECVGFQIPAPESICRGEARNLALLIFTLLKGDDGIPMPWLSDQQFILANWLAGVDPNNPAGNLLSVLCEEPVDLCDSSRLQFRNAESTDPLLRLAHRLMLGDLSLYELSGSLESYIQWRDSQLAETSVETEVKAVFNRVSAFFQSGQEVMKTALSKSIENSW